MRNTFGNDRIQIGLSSHAEDLVPDIVAYKNYNLSMLEKHFCLSRHSFVHHIDCSLEPQEFKYLVDFCKSSHRADKKVLHPDAYKSSFGMSAVEKEFLVKQTYGNTYLGTQSEL